MEKGFLNQITEKMEGYDLHLFIKKKGDIISVIVSPIVQGKDKDYLPPVTISGKVDDLDKKFLEDITKATEITSGVVSDLNKFEEQMNKKRDEQKEKSEKKSSGASAVSKAKAKAKAKKKELTPAEKTKKHLDQAKSYFDRKRYKQAIASFDEALKFASGKEKQSIKDDQMQAKVKMKAAQEECTYDETLDVADPVEAIESEAEENEDEEEEEVQDKDVAENEENEEEKD
jgi:hypothetical protein